MSHGYDSMEYEDMTVKQMYVELKGSLLPEGKTYLLYLKKAEY